MPINSAYFNSVEEQPRPHPKAVHFEDQPGLFSPTHKEKTFAGLVSFFEHGSQKAKWFQGSI